MEVRDKATGTIKKEHGSIKVEKISILKRGKDGRAVNVEEDILVFQNELEEGEELVLKLAGVVSCGFQDWDIGTEIGMFKIWIEENIKIALQWLKAYDAARRQ